MFDDDSFRSDIEDLFSQLAGRRRLDSSGNGFIESEEEERNMDFVQTDDYVYVVFELPGYKEGDVDVSIKGSELRVLAQGKASESSDEYIARKLHNGVSITKLLPEYIIFTNYKTTFRNGILEICFKKK